MLTYQELLSEIKRRPPGERLALLEELAHSLREDLAPEADSQKPEDLGWPPGYFEQTFGILRDDPIERGPQGEYETREELQ